MVGAIAVTSALVAIFLGKLPVIFLDGERHLVKSKPQAPHRGFFPPVAKWSFL